MNNPGYVNGVQRFTLKHADGTQRLVAGIQSPEAWVEDFGTGTLANGAATVTLDADFAAIAETGDYLVFLTAYGDFHAHVARQDATGFVVQVTTGTGGVAGQSGRFGWRVAARPKEAGGKVQRLAKYTSPAIKIPGVDELPKPPPPIAPPEKPRDPAVPPPAPNPAPQPRVAPSPPPPVAPAAIPPPAAPPAPQPAPPPRT